MNDTNDKTPDTSADAKASRKPTDASALRQLGGMALWKKLVLFLAIGCMAAGVALPFVVQEEMSPDETRAVLTDPGDTAGGATGLAPQGLMPTDPGGGEGTGERTTAGAEGTGPGPVNPWSTSVFRLGFSFVAGFAIAFAVRSFIKVTLIAVGMFLLFLFGLEYAGLVTVDWGAVSSHYDSFSGWLAAETSSFKDFITGRLPSAATAVAGLGIGFTRK